MATMLMCTKLGTSFFHFRSSCTRCSRYQPSAAGALSYTRTVTSSDVLYIAGVPDDLRVTNFDKEETASFDSSHTLQLAQGNMHVSLASLSSAQHASDWSRRR